MPGSDPFVGEICLFPFNFAPKGWAFCNGQLLPISQNTALFSLLGTYYGGDGKSTFALPDLQGRVPMHPGQGAGLSLYDLGQTGGSDTVTLLNAELPIHSHSLQYGATPGSQEAPTGQIWKDTGGRRGALAYTGAVNTAAMGAEAILPSGGGQPHNNMQPYLTLNFCIALQGVYPPRS
ncbi:tail Collar domain-containing protein [Paenibacillus marchantiophytorum]|uniref:Tail Collar domain-containing protein n=1 Tax=Paenibacillus marchantiophytorum TaxID=1619310 RepID=A0ABQ1FHT8_9BACL|nr:tail fiber protein [Paenibacillus marchantiophytorum]GGA12684.1 tail Collar domain-containing protein [Paenibacillus marchantiophytorum]